MNVRSWRSVWYQGFQGPRCCQGSLEFFSEEQPNQCRTGISNVSKALYQRADAWTVKAEKTLEITISIKLSHECYPAIVSEPAAQTVKARVCYVVSEGKVLIH